MTPASSSPSRPAARRGLARFDTLRIKLFAAIAGANALLALTAFVVFSWSFDQGLVEYLNRADEARLQPLVARLAEVYRRDGEWRFSGEERRKFYDLTREVMGAPRPPVRRPDEVGPSAPVVARAASAPLATAPPSNDLLLTIDPRLMLFDAERQLVVGRAEMVPEAVLKPITLDGAVVGHLGYVPRLKIVESLEKLFAAQQNRKFAAIAAVMLLAGLVIAALLADWLSRRIRRLAQGAHALIQGRYDERIEPQGHDELAQLAQDFNQLAQTLDAARRARQQWIADIAHELRTPLAVLRAEIEALQDGVRPLTQGSVGSLAQEVAQLARLVDDLRVLSLSDLGALTYQKEALDLAELIDDGLAVHASALRSKGITLRTALAEHLRIDGDATRLAQVFANLVQNTLRYTDAPGALEVTLTRDGPHAVLDWRDSSPGVPEAELPRLTERLYRVDGSRSRAGGGSGLGLAIVQAIVEAHGGTLQAGPSPLGGLAWRITFPRIETEAPHG